MADQKITGLTNFDSSNTPYWPPAPASDVIPIVDISDNTMAASGTTKKISINNLLSSSPTASGNFTITGDLTVRTNKLAVTSTGVGMGTASPAYALDVAGGVQVTSGSAGGLYQWAYGASASSRSWRAWNDVSANGDFQISTSTTRTGSTYSDRYRIDVTGVHEWSNTSGLAMALNATGLGVGIVPSGGAKLAIRDSGSNDSYIGLGANNDIYLSTGASGVHYFRKGGAAASMTLDAPGNLLVGTATPNFTNTNGFVVAQTTDATYISVGHVTGTATGSYYCSFGYNGTQIGSITQNGTTGVLYNINSDYRLKESVAPLSGGLARVSALKPSIYKWKSDGSSGEGFLAHELAEVVPFAVTGEKDAVNENGTIKTQGIDMSRIVPILVAAVQELTARVQTLETR